MTIPIGLTNRSVYNHMLIKKEKELNDSEPVCNIVSGVVGGVIAVSAVIMILGGIFIPSYDGRGNQSSESLRNVRIFEGFFGGVIITAIVVGILFCVGDCIKSSKKLKKMDVYLLNFPQKESSKGIIGMENLLGGSTRKDLLIQGFESQFPKVALKELNFTQLIVLYEKCPNVVDSKRAYLHPYFQKVFLELEQFLAMDPVQLGIVLNDINHQAILSNEHLLILLFRYLSEPQFAEKSVHSTLTTLYRKVTDKFNEEELQQWINRLRKVSKDTVVELEDI